MTQAKATLSEIRQALESSQLDKQQLQQLTSRIDSAEEALEQAAENQDKQAAVQAITDLETQMRQVQTAQSQSGSNQQGQQQSAQADGAEAAEIQVQQPSPDVTVLQPAPDVTVQQQAPDVAVRQPEPEVSVNQAKPDVTVQQQGKAEVDVVREGETEVTVLRPGEEQQTAQVGGAEQERETETRQAQSIGPAGMEETRTATADPAAAPSQSAGQSAGLAQAENLMGQSVMGPNGEEIGDINDLLVDRTSGDIQAIVVEVGGFLGIGGRQVMIPWQEANYNPGEGSVSVSLTKEQIEAMPEFNRDQLGENMVGMGEQ